MINIIPTKLLEVLIVLLLQKIGVQDPTALIQGTVNNFQLFTVQTLVTIVSNNVLYFIFFTLIIAMVIASIKYVRKYSEEMKVMKEREAFSFKEAKVKEWVMFLNLVRKSVSDKEFDKVSRELKLTNTMIELQNRKGNVNTWHIIYEFIKSHDVRHIFWCSMLFLSISFCLKQVNYIFVMVANYALLELGFGVPFLNDLINFGIGLMLLISVILAIVKSNKNGKLLTLILNINKFKH